MTLLVNLSFIYAQELALVRDNGLFGYVDKSGGFMIEPRFKKALGFSGNRAAVKKDGKWGYIDSNGGWAIPPQFSKAKSFNSGLALVHKDGEWKYINTQGEILNTPSSDKYYDFQDDGVAFLRESDKVGFMSLDGKIVLIPTYEKITGFKNGHARVVNKDLWGLIDKKGNLVVPLEYSAIGNYSSNGLWAQKGDEYGVIVDGVFKPVLDAVKIRDFTENSMLAIVEVGKMDCGFINGNGDWIIQPKYRYALDFKAGLAPVEKDGKWGYIDEKGKTIIAHEFRSAEQFSEDGLAPVSSYKYVEDKEKWGFVDKSGTLVVPMKYAIAPKHVNRGFYWLKKGFVDGVARVKYNKKWGYLLPNGSVLGNMWYDNAEYFVDTSE